MVMTNLTINVIGEDDKGNEIILGTQNNVNQTQECKIDITRSGYFVGMKMITKDGYTATLSKCDYRVSYGKFLVRGDEVSVYPKNNTLHEQRNSLR